MPENAETSSVCGVCSGRPRPRLLPPATISSGSSRATAAATMSTSSRSSLGRKRVMGACSEPRQIGKSDLALMNVHAAELGAAMELREDLAGIEQACGVEGAFEALLLVEVDFVEHGGHEVALLDADAMLTGEDTADLDAVAQYICTEFLGTLELARVVGV